MPDTARLPERRSVRAERSLASWHRQVEARLHALELRSGRGASVFADFTERDVKIPDPLAGTECYVLDSGTDNDFGTPLPMKCRYDGSGWLGYHDHWAAYSPAFTNMTAGSGATHEGRFMRLGMRMLIKWSVVFGTGGGVTGSGPAISLPTDFLDDTGDAGSGLGWGLGFMRDVSASGNNAYIHGVPTAPNLLTLQYLIVSTSIAVRNASITATVPFDSTDGDSLRLWAEYTIHPDDVYV